MQVCKYACMQVCKYASILKLVITCKNLFPFAPVVRLVIFLLVSEYHMLASVWVYPFILFPNREVEVELGLI